MKSRLFVFVVLIILAVSLFAFLMRGIVENWIILPLAKVIWVAKGYFGAFPQADYWVAALGIAALIAFLSLRLPVWERRRQPTHIKQQPGTVREMTFWLQRAKGGIYPKWYVAHILGELALDILDRRGIRYEHAYQLAGLEWSPPPDVKKFLESALTTNYTDYPRSIRVGFHPSSPLDQDLEPVIKYLESLLEKEND